MGWVALVSWMPERVSVTLTLTHDDSSDEGGEEQRGQRHRLRCQDAAPRSTHGLMAASRHRCSQTFAATSTTTAPRSGTATVSALSVTPGAFAHRPIMSERPADDNHLSAGNCPGGSAGHRAVSALPPGTAVTGHAAPHDETRGPQRTRLDIRASLRHRVPPTRRGRASVCVIDGGRRSPAG